MAWLLRLDKERAYGRAANVFGRVGLRLAPHTDPGRQLELVGVAATRPPRLARRMEEWLDRWAYSQKAIAKWVGIPALGLWFGFSIWMIASALPD